MLYPMPKTSRIFCVPLIALLVAGGPVQAAVAPSPVMGRTEPLTPRTRDLRAADSLVEPVIVFRHGDISWLPELAAAAGWPPETWDRLGRIILRESGGCPGRIGGSKVDKNCNIVGWDGSNHRSDSGLTQLNGTHWKPDHPQYSGLICRELAICTQAPLLDPFLNLVAAKVLYDVAGWTPWTVVSP